MLRFALMIPIRARVVAAALSVAFGSVGAAQSPSVSLLSKRMLDGKQWTTQNVDVTTAPSDRYDNSASQLRAVRPVTPGSRHSTHAAPSAAAGDCRRTRNGAAGEALRRNSPGVDRPRQGSVHGAHYRGSSGFDAVDGGGRTGKSGEYRAGRGARILPGSGPAPWPEPAPGRTAPPQRRFSVQMFPRISARSNTTVLPRGDHSG